MKNDKSAPEGEAPPREKGTFRDGILFSSSVVKEYSLPASELLKQIAEKHCPISPPTKRLPRAFAWLDEHRGWHIAWSAEKDNPYEKHDYFPIAEHEQLMAAEKQRGLRAVEEAYLEAARNFRECGETALEIFFTEKARAAKEPS